MFSLQVVFLAVSPGHVQTDMGNASGRVAPLTVDHVAERLVELAARADQSMSGGGWSAVFSLLCNLA